MVPDTARARGTAKAVKSIQTTLAPNWSWC